MRPHTLCVGDSTRGGTFYASRPTRKGVTIIVTPESHEEKFTLIYKYRCPQMHIKYEFNTLFCYLLLITLVVYGLLCLVLVGFGGKESQ